MTVIRSVASVGTRAAVDIDGLRSEPASSGAAIVSLRGVTKRYGSRLALDDLTLEILSGERFGLVGPNGAGKTTCISIICGLVRADGGEVVVAGYPVPRRSRQAAACIGYVPQDVALYGDLTGEENLHFFGRVAGLTGRGLRDRVAAVLVLAGLADRRRERVSAYSGGMKRRLNIAAGLLGEPQLLVLDEPTVGVDPQSRYAILETLGELANAGMTILLTSHNLDEVERVCARIGVLDHGRLKAVGSPASIRASTGDEAVTIVVDGSPEVLAAACRSLPGVRAVAVTRGAITVNADDVNVVLADIVASAHRAGVRITSLSVGAPDFESAFLDLTGTMLRD